MPGRWSEPPTPSASSEYLTIGIFVLPVAIIGTVLLVANQPPSEADPASSRVLDFSLCRFLESRLWRTGLPDEPMHPGFGPLAVAGGRAGARGRGRCGVRSPLATVGARYRVTVPGRSKPV